MKVKQQLLTHQLFYSLCNWLLFFCKHCYLPSIAKVKVHFETVGEGKITTGHKDCESQEENCLSAKREKWGYIIGFNHIQLVWFAVVTSNDSCTKCYGSSQTKILDIAMRTWKSPNSAFFNSYKIFFFPGFYFTVDLCMRNRLQIS